MTHIYIYLYLTAVYVYSFYCCFKGEAAEMAKSSNSARHALVIDERAIELCGMAMPKLLASVANGSRSVVACRAGDMGHSGFALPDRRAVHGGLRDRIHKS